MNYQEFARQYDWTESLTDLGIDQDVNIDIDSHFFSQGEQLSLWDARLANGDYALFVANNAENKVLTYDGTSQEDEINEYLSIKNNA